MRVCIGLIMVLGLFACGKGSKGGGGELPRNARVEAQATPPAESVAPPVFVKELVTQSSLGVTKLEIYQGEKGNSPVLGRVGEVVGHSIKTYYPENPSGLPNERVEPSVSSTFPVYWAEIKPDGVALVTFVDEAFADDLINAHRDLKIVDVQPPGIEYCALYQFRGKPFLSEAAQKRFNTGLGSFEPESSVACRYSPSIQNSECALYFNPLHSNVPWKVENKEFIDQEKAAYSCIDRKTWFPAKIRYTDTLDLKALVVTVGSDDPSIEIKEDHSSLIPGGNQMKTISFSETELKFTL